MRKCFVIARIVVFFFEGGGGGGEKGKIFFVFLTPEKILKI